MAIYLGVSVNISQINSCVLDRLYC